MNYYFNKVLNLSFEEAIVKTTEALKIYGFGVITTIHMHEKLKEKLNVDFKRYTVLGACNPTFAHKALLSEEKIGIMLPCNILVIEQSNSQIEVAAVNPIASMQAVNNPALEEVAKQVTSDLKMMIDSL